MLLLFGYLIVMMAASMLSAASGNTKDHSAYLAQRYGAFWHHMDKNVAVPPCLSKKAKHQKLLPWSGNGGFTTAAIAAGDTMRIWVEPWNSTRPIQTYVNTDGTAMIGPNNSAGNPDPEISFPASSALVAHGYQGYGFAEAGLDLDSRTYFMGGEISGIAYVDRASRGTINIIGQNEIRDIGIGSIDATNINRDIGELPEDWLHDPTATDFEVSTSAGTLGGMNNLKTPQPLYPEKDQYNQRIYFTQSIAPPHVGSIKMINNLGAGATAGSKFLVPASRVVTYSATYDFCDTTSGNDDGTIAAVSTTTDTTGEYLGRPITMTDGTVGALPATITYHTDGKKRIVRATQQPMQSLKSGMPLIEVACQTGTVSVSIEFKMFYQVVVGKDHPQYEQALFGAYTDIDETSIYQQFCTSTPGFSMDSREAAIKHKKKSAKHRAIQMGKTGNRHLMHILQQETATPQNVQANQGIGKPMREEHNWLMYVQKESADHDNPLPKLQRIDDDYANPNTVIKPYLPTRSLAQSIADHRSVADFDDY